MYDRDDKNRDKNAIHKIVKHLEKGHLIDIGIGDINPKTNLPQPSHEFIISGFGYLNGELVFEGINYTKYDIEKVKIEGDRGKVTRLIYAKDLETHITDADWIESRQPFNENNFKICKNY